MFSLKQSLPLFSNSCILRFKSASPKKGFIASQVTKKQMRLILGLTMIALSNALKCHHCVEGQDKIGLDDLSKAQCHEKEKGRLVHCFEGVCVEAQSEKNGTKIVQRACLEQSTLPKSGKARVRIAIF